MDTSQETRVLNALDDGDSQHPAGRTVIISFAAASPCQSTTRQQSHCYAVLVGGSNGDGAWRGMVTIFE